MHIQVKLQCILVNKVIFFFTLDKFTTSGGFSDADHKPTELEECTAKEVPYIPYSLATLHMIKVKKPKTNIPLPQRKSYMIE